MTIIILSNIIHSALYIFGEGVFMENELRLGHMFKLIHIMFESVMNKDLKKFDITLAQVDVLLFLYSKRNCSVSNRDIEKHFKLTNPTVTGLIKRMEEKGFITRECSCIDGRSKVIEITPKSVEICKELSENIRKRDRELLRGFTQEQGEELFILMNKVYKNLKNLEEKE